MGSSTQATNCIVAESDQGNGIFVETGSTIDIGHCLFDNNSPDHIEVNGTAPNEHDNIEDEDPLIICGYHISADSPCLDAGDNSGVLSGEKDVDGQGRIYNEVIDIGADELWTSSDVNGDGCVDDTDLAIVLQNFGLECAIGDINGDGIVDDEDLAIVLEDFGLGCE